MNLQSKSSKSRTHRNPILNQCVLHGVRLVAVAASLWERRSYGQNTHILIELILRGKGEGVGKQQAIPHVETSYWQQESSRTSHAVLHLDQDKYWHIHAVQRSVCSKYSILRGFLHVSYVHRIIHSKLTQSIPNSQKSLSTTVSLCIVLILHIINTNGWEYDRIRSQDGLGQKIYDCYLFWKPLEFLDGCRMDILTDTDVGIYNK